MSSVKSKSDADTRKGKGGVAGSSAAAASGIAASAIDDSGAAAAAAAGAGKKKGKRSKKGDDDEDDDSSEEEVVRPDSDDSDAEPSAPRKARLASESAEAASLAAYLSTPSTYVSATPGLVLPASEQAERDEVEQLLSKLKAHQAGVMKARQSSTRELESMRSAIKKVRKDTEELLKSQQQNIATMGRKLH